MSELKAEQWLDYAGEPRPCYPKSTADKVIKGLKSEIERLEILCANYRHDCDNLAISNEQAKRAARTLLKKMNHNKYRRCLAMANYWGLVSACTRGGIQLKCMRRELKWHKLADKFKEAK